VHLSDEDAGQAVVAKSGPHCQTFAHVGNIEQNSDCSCSQQRPENHSRWQEQSGYVYAQQTLHRTLISSDPYPHTGQESKKNIHFMPGLQQT
jgi:hypothetical protein